MNDVALTAALATAPSSAFRELRERPRFWFPLVLMVLASAAIVYWYYSVVDVDWLKDLMFGNNPKMQGMPADQRAKAMGFVTRTTLLWGGVVFGCFIAIPVITLIQGLFLLLAAKATKVQLGFKHWFSMAAWASLPALIGIVVAAIMLAMSDTPQISSETIAPLSLNSLLFHRAIGSPGQGYLDAIGIPGMLCWLLMIIGVRTWTQRSWLFSTVFVMLPIVVLHGIWAYVSFH